jgi:hypothetical protein
VSNNSTVTRPWPSSSVERLLVKIKRDIENQIRGLLKNLGLVIGQAKMNVFAVRAAELAANRPALTAAVGPLRHARLLSNRLRTSTERCSNSQGHVWMAPD